MNLNVNLDANLDAGICAVNYNVHVKILFMSFCHFVQCSVYYGHWRVVEREREKERERKREWEKGEMREKDG